MNDSVNFQDLVPENLLSELNYYTQYYGQEFRQNQGTEFVLECVREFSIDGSLIDFGSGSNIFFWLYAFKKVENVTCIDISREAFFINELIRKEVFIPKSFEYLISMFGNKTENVFRTNISYVIADVFNESITQLPQSENVSQFGLLGLCKSKEAYAENLVKLLKLVKQGGRFIGANWVFSDRYAAAKGFSNDYLLDKELIDAVAFETGLEKMYYRVVEIVGDVNYKNVVIYVLGR